VKHAFNTSVGTIEVLVDPHSRIVSVYRFDAGQKPVAAAIESWDYMDLSDVLMWQAGVPAHEARQIAGLIHAEYAAMGSPAERADVPARKPSVSVSQSAEYAGLALRFVAVLLDGIIVFVPLFFVVGLMSGGGYRESGPGYARAGIDLSGKATLLLLLLSFGYYIFCEAATGMTLGKRMVGIRVVGEEGEELTFGASVVRNLLRIVDGLFFYLIGAVFYLASSRGQRLGDRAARTIVVRS
jgi:uncharacterized RDD family membrane protein YckC